MNLHSLATAAIGVAVFALILYRQLRSQPVGDSSGYRRPVVFGAVGVVLGGQYLLNNRVTVLALTGFVLSMVVGAALAHVRARSVHLWRRDGAWWRRGTAVTVLLWFVAIGSHLGLDALVGLVDPAEGVGRGFGYATTLLYLGVSLGLQHRVLLRRVARLDAEAVAPTWEPSGLAG